jgi:cytoskeleton protein RodZ
VILFHHHQAGELPLESRRISLATPRDCIRDTLDLLKAERLSRGWTLQDASDRTRINITFLSALESGKTEKLGSSFAVEALIKKYADALQVQTEQNEDRRRKITERGAARPGKFPQYIMTGSLLIAIIAAVLWGHAFWKIQDTKNSPSKPYVQPLTSTSPEREISSGNEEPSLQHNVLPEIKNQVPESSPPGETDTAVSTSETNVTAKREPDGNPVVRDLPAAPVPPGHSLEIVTAQKTWIQVVVDGKNAGTELLQAGETRKWQAIDKVDLVVGNGGGVRIQWDGKPVELSSKPGRTLLLTLPEH